MNILKKELSDEQFILLNMDYPNHQKKSKMSHKQTENQRIKDVKKHEYEKLNLGVLKI